MTSLLLILGAVCAVFFTIYAARGTSPNIQEPHQLQGLTTSIDIDAFRNLVSRTEDDYLRSNLPPADFRRIQRARLLAALAYVKTAAHNASILLRLAETGRRSSDTLVATSAAELAESALQVRFHAVLAIANLYMALLSPHIRIACLGAVDRYQSLTRNVTYFVSLSRPGHTGIVADSI